MNILKRLVNKLLRKKKPKYKQSSQYEYIQSLHHRALTSMGQEVTKEESDLRMAQIEAVTKNHTWH